MSMLRKGMLLAMMPEFIPQLGVLLDQTRPPVTYARPKHGRVLDVPLMGSMDLDYSTRLRMAINSGLNEPGVVAIRLLVSSPGGFVSGTIELSDAISAAAKRKPIYAILDEVCASGAYWAICGATSISASPSCEIGSIGVRRYLIDDTEAFRKMGMRAVAIDTGPMKSLGMPGVEITEEQIEHLQEDADYLMLKFQAAIERGRRLSPKAMSIVSSGGVWWAPLAKTLGLIDHVEVPEEAYARIEDLHREQFTDLTGRAAVDKVNDLGKRFGSSSFDWRYAGESSLAELRAEFPTLCAAADAHLNPPPAQTARRYSSRYIPRC